jgi:nucleoside-diphosphate-sugar epimerase
MANVLVTGGAGYIGSILTPLLLTLGHRVTVLDNIRYGKNSLAHVCIDENFDVVKGDVRDERALRPLVAKADYIIPLAALVGTPLCESDPIAATTTNRNAIELLCSLASKDQRIIAPTTNSGYGIGEKHAYCTEETPLRPISLYGRDKAAVEGIMFERENAICLRLATVFGMSPRLRIDLLVNDFVHRAAVDRFVVLFEAHFKRNHIHVRDVARTFVHAMDNFDTMKGRPYNVGLSDTNISKLELCQRIEAHVPGFQYPEAPVGTDPDQRDYIVSNARLEATGWKPTISLDDGIRELLKGYRMIRNRVYGNV